MLFVPVFVPIYLLWFFSSNITIPAKYKQNREVELLSNLVVVFFENANGLFKYLQIQSLEMKSEELSKLLEMLRESLHSQQQGSGDLETRAARVETVETRLQELVPRCLEITNYNSLSTFITIPKPYGTCNGIK